MLIPGVHTPLAGKKKKALRPLEMQWPSAGLFSASPHQCPCTRGAPRGVRGGVGGSAPFASLRSDPGMIGQGRTPPFSADGTSRASPMGVLPGRPRGLKVPPALMLHLTAVSEPRWPPRFYA